MVQQQSAATAPTKMDQYRPTKASELRQRPSTTFMRLVCIQMLSLVPGSHTVSGMPRGLPLPQILVGFTRMKCAGTPSIHGSSPASMNGARSASVSR
jgi:hypothetical protein